MKTENYGAVQISQDIDLDKTLEKIPIDLRNKGLRDAVAAATKIVAASYRKRVPVGTKPKETKRLNKTITFKVKAYNDGQTYVGLAGARRTDGNHAHLIELGHDVKPRGRAKGFQIRRKDKIGRMASNLFNEGNTESQTINLLSRIKLLSSELEKGKTALTGKKRIKGRFDQVAAIDTTQSAQNKAVEDSLAKSIAKAGG